MPTSYREYDPNQGLLLPEDMREWLPDGHLAWHVSELVEGLDLTAFHAPYSGADGRRNQPYDPRMMVKVLLYAYATGTFSSRKIARKLEEDLAYRVLGAGNFPAHRTICAFRKRHWKDFEKLFVEVVQLAARLGFAKFGKVSVDGTKVRANASKRKSKRVGKLSEEEARLRGEVSKLLERAREVDEAEDEKYGPESRGDETPEKLRDRKARARALERAKGELAEQRRREKEARAGGEAPEDAESGESKADLDVRALERLNAVVEARENVERDYEERKEKARERDRKAENGRRVRGPRQKQQGNTTDADSRVMKTPQEGYQQCYNGQLVVDGEHQVIVAAELVNNGSDHGLLPGLLDRVGETYGRRPEEVLADGGYCNEDDLLELEAGGVEACVNVPKDKRESSREKPERFPATARMRDRMETEACRGAYSARAWRSEAPNGWIKHVLGFRQFSMRGLEAARGEWNLVCMALNIRRLHGLTASAAGAG